MNTSRLKALRETLAKNNVQGYLVPRADEFQGEFVAPYADRLKWLTGFSGSGGAALILKDKAFLLTDGRYLLQGASQTDSNEYEVGDYIAKPPAQWIIENATAGDVIAYDPWLHTPSQIQKIADEIAEHGITLKGILGNLVDAIWSDQPSRPIGNVTLLPDEVAGQKSLQKRASIIASMREEGLDAFIFALPDSIAWILNIRGSDIDYIPSALSYLMIEPNGALSWFINPAKISDDIKAHIGNDLNIIPPEGMEDAITAINGTIGMDYAVTPIWFYDVLMNAQTTLRDIKDPSIHPKSIKSNAEQDNIRQSHVLDGVALVKFLKWLEEEAPTGGQSEISAAQKLHDFRAENPNFRGNSFPTISGFGANGAIIHYRADEQSNANIENGNLLLLDSGGQYAGASYGTTDITRTISIGTSSDHMRRMNTLVLMGHIDLARAVFAVGATGVVIDALARKPLKDEGLNYAHGTGHGVGCYLAVHEEAASISPRGKSALEAGMFISNEPGYYEEGAFGIRIENLVLVIEAGAGELAFETLSLAPIDKSLIIKDMLSDEQKAWLDAYHAKTYKRLSPHLDTAHEAWLREKTKPL